MKDNLNALRELRDVTGAGIMDCKKYLKRTDGNLKEAIKLMRSEEGLKADKKSTKIAAEGKIYFHSHDNRFLLIEINSETDFVARSDDFKNFVNILAQKIIASDFQSYSDLLADKNSGIYQEIEEMRKNIITKLGENICIRKYIMIKQDSKNYVNGYVHNDKIGAIVVLKNQNKQLSKDIAMQIVASNPIALDHNSVNPEILANEKEIYKAELDKLEKKDDIKRNILEGKLKKYLNDNTLLNQPFIKDEKITLKKIIKDNEVISYVRYQLGEGICKEKDDFVQEVYNQIK